MNIYNFYQIDFYVVLINYNEKIYFNNIIRLGLEFLRGTARKQVCVSSSRLNNVLVVIYNKLSDFEIAV